MTSHYYDPDTALKLGIDEEITSQGGTSALAAAAVFDNGNSGSAKTVALANGSHQKITLTASGPTLTVTGFTVGQYGEVTLYVVQDATGSRTLPTFSPAADYGTPGAPTLTTAANKIDILKLSSIDGGTTLDVITVIKGL